MSLLAMRSSAQNAAKQNFAKRQVQASAHRTMRHKFD